ncbi:MAG: extracellular solute-binding protein [Eubacteriales bacterium]|nr:extracellular solute-binding protein [Eubacteriales bacterium]
MKRKLLALVLVLATLVSMSSIAVAQAEEPLKLSAICALYSAAPAKDSDFWKWMEETYHVDYDVEWVASGSLSEKLGVLFSTGDIPDVVQVTSTTDPIVVNAINEGMFYDLTDLIGDYDNLAALSKNGWNNSAVNGRNYVLPRTRGQYNCTMYVRGDILDEMGVGVPVTISEYVAYFRYLKANYPDMIPVAMNMDQMIEFFQGAFGDGSRNPVYTEDGEGILWYGLTDAYASYIQWLADLYAEGLFGSEFVLYNQDTNSDLFLSGLTGIRYQNIWHYYRLDNALRQTPGLEKAYLKMALSVTSDDGKYISVNYDAGFYGGLLLNANLSEEKVRAILDFFNKTADPAMYNTFRYGIEGVHWNMVDNYPVATEKGAEEVTNSFYSPFVLATSTYDKVISPLADGAFNDSVIANLADYDAQVAKINGVPLELFDVITSGTWSENWGFQSEEFNAYVTETIQGQHSIDDLKAYQQKIKDEDWAKEAFKEFAVSFTQHGLDEYMK